MPRRRKIKVIKKRLKKVWGYAHLRDRIIEIDDRLRGKKLIEILLHETAHIIMPDATEDEINDLAISQTQVLWDELFKTLDNANPVPLQDGSK